MRARLAASAAALALASTLLVADSAGPNCARFAPFSGDWVYSTDCLGGDRGVVRLAFPGDGRTGPFQVPPTDEVAFEQASGTLGVDLANVRWDVSDCWEGDGTGTMEGLDFYLAEGAVWESADSGDTAPPEPAADVLHCTGWRLGEPFQHLRCRGKLEEGRCSLHLSPLP